MATTSAVDLDDLLREVEKVARPHAGQGAVGASIPSMAQLDPDSFGLALVEMDGTEHVVGDVDVAIPIQSISKVFALVLAMQEAEAGRGITEELWSRIGVEPSGDPFNSLVQLESERGIPRNPMINAGAHVVDDILLDHCPDARASIRSLVSRVAGADVEVDEAVWREEGSSGDRNRSMAYLMASFGNLTHPVDDVLDVYNYQCSLSMTPRQLARAVRFLANGGRDPATDTVVLPREQARRVAALMLTCGTYDAAGDFAFNVGIPCKSGVAGAIVGVVSGEFGVCVWSPPLGPSGNSAAGTAALHELSERLGLSLF